MLLKKISAGIALLGFFTGMAFALQPGFNVQGRLTDAGGNPKNGNFVLMFTVYPGETGGAPIWAKTSPTDVTNGNFQALLEGAGDVPYSTIESAVRDLPGAYVEVKVGEETPPLIWAQNINWQSCR